MKELKQTIWETTDGKEFKDKKEASNHQSFLDGLVFYRITYGPDLTEGRHGPKKEAYIAVNSNDNHHQFANYAAYKIFGPPVDFVQGVFGSNAVTDSWRMSKVNKIPMPLEKVIRVEDRFAKNKKWGEGIHAGEKE